MGDVLIIADWFPIYKDGIKTAEKEYVASHGIDLKTGKSVIVQCIHPQKLGAIKDRHSGEWIIKRSL